MEKLFDQLDVRNRVCIAAENGYSRVTISGDEDAINIVESHFRRELSTIFCRRFNSHIAFHSHHVEPMKSEFLSKIRAANIATKQAEARFFSMTSGKEMNGSKVGDWYWWRNIRYPVFLKQAVEKMIQSGARILIEISPQPTISHHLTDIAKKIGVREITVLQVILFSLIFETTEWQLV